MGFLGWNFVGVGLYSIYFWLLEFKERRWGCSLHDVAQFKVNFWQFRYSSFLHRCHNAFVFWRRQNLLLIYVSACDQWVKKMTPFTFGGLRLMKYDLLAYYERLCSLFLGGSWLAFRESFRVTKSSYEVIWCPQLWLLSNHCCNGLLHISNSNWWFSLLHCRLCYNQRRVNQVTLARCIKLRHVIQCSRAQVCAAQIRHYEVLLLQVMRW